MITVSTKGDFNNTQGFINRILNGSVFSDLESYGQQGVAALASATPVDTGLTASSWSYKVSRNSDGMTIEWFNSNDDDAGTPIVIMLQYGHGTGTGGYVAGRDFINPALKPLFDQITNDVWKKVTS